ncbi:DUF1489 family protein [Brucella thiophenivorans]|uniref:DUF1489 family protein n=1 Tax=Brucella thiophenivorans TaxID=571255 RepID=A0A256FXW4_9HYPH|nr:DUF1489 family protein [Brucella thiophenivorans]OYR19261.1 hypothetical protein CEV31_2609 [Brucella thiophenivorans]
MPLNLVKLCVGCDSIEDLASWIDFRLAEQRAAGLVPEQFHTTRMVPKRADELLAGGSLYWVIKGNVQCRQRLLDVRPFTDDQGINRCHLVLEPKIHPTDWQPRRAFQGWRYLNENEVPLDEAAGKSGRATLPSALRQELAALGLL